MYLICLMINKDFKGFLNPMMKKAGEACGQCLHHLWDSSSYKRSLTQKCHDIVRNKTSLKSSVSSLG